MTKKKVPQDEQRIGFKGELVDEKYQEDFDSPQSYKKKNPYKTPPNNLTSKKGLR